MRKKRGKGIRSKLKKALSSDKLKALASAFATAAITQAGNAIGKHYTERALQGRGRNVYLI